MPIGAVVADASVLLSAVIGKAAQKISSKHDLEVHASEYNAMEVVEYLPAMGKWIPTNWSLSKLFAWVWQPGSLGTIPMKYPS